MIYPTITEYIEAIRFSEDNFDKLTNLVPVLKDNGEPYYSSGNFAVVFKMKDKESGKLHAVKCFLKDQEGREESYRKISNYLETIENRYLIKTKFLENELFVDSKSTDQTEFPVVVMDWVEGVPLDVYIREKINDKMYLEYLCYTFSLMAQNLIEQEFAHGDLKPDNILVKEDGMLVLVDYDGMYVPEMFGERSRELGSPDFQHPDRKLIDFDNHLDDFSLASILLSLKLISIDPSLLERFGDKDRLLFSQKDYRDFYTSEINKVIVGYFENKDVYMLYCLFIQGLERKVCLWSKDMWMLEPPCFWDYWDDCLDLVPIISDLSDFDDGANIAIALFYIMEVASYRGIEILMDLSYKGNVMAQRELGYCYEKGEVVDVDLDKAILWYSKSAEQGDSMAQFHLGNCYYNGNGVECNMSKAIELFSKSADKGVWGAKKQLADCYFYGKGVAKNYFKAVEFYLEFSECDSDFKRRLAECYANGWGVPMDKSLASYWRSEAGDDDDLPF